MGLLDFGTLKTFGDCHTSDIGHWFAMTASSLVRQPLPLPEAGLLFFSQSGLDPGFVGVHIGVGCL